MPLILLPFPMRGVVYCLQTTIYIHKQSRYIFYASLAAGAVHLVANVLLNLDETITKE